MVQPKQYQEWLAVRARLLAEERAFAQARAAYARGEPTDLQDLSIKQSEIRALRALSRSLFQRSARAGERAGRDGADSRY